MQALEFHFNPKEKEGVVIDSFVFEPEKESEKKLGNLYLAGKLSNTLPREKNLLEELTEVIKKEYYYDLQKSAESSLEQSVKKVNEFLAKEVKKGAVHWIGNLDFAFISVAPLKIRLTEEESDPEFKINFSQTGNMKILLIREKEILDISQDIKENQSENYPPKPFGNIVSGRLMPNDKIIIANKSIFEFFKEKDLIRKFLKASDQKSINEIFKSRRKEFSELSGVCLFLITEKETLKKKKTISVPAIPFKKIMPKIPSLPKLNFSFLKRGPLPKINQFQKPSFPSLPSKLKEKIVPVLLLIVLLMSASFLFKEEKEKEFRESKEIIDSAEAERAQAENFLTFKEENKANLAFQSAWLKLEELLQEEKTSLNESLYKEAEDLQKSIEESLFSLNEIERMETPELVTEVSREETNIIPQKITSLEILGETFLFFSNPFTGNLYEINLNKEEEKVLEFEEDIRMMGFFPDSLLLLTEPNLAIRYFPGSGEKEEFELSPQSFNPDLKSPATYGSNIYFLNSKEGKIVKFSLSDKNVSSSEWLSPQTEKRPFEAKSMAIDGDIWVLTNDFKVDRYYQGLFSKSFKINIFPILKNPTKIFTSPNISRIYILEPIKKRIIVMTKHGEVIKQYSSDKFNNLQDLSVSKNEERIYLLNGKEVYKIDL